MYLNTPSDPPPEEDVLNQAAQMAALASSRQLSSSELASVREWLDGRPDRAAALQVVMDSWDEAPSTLAALGYKPQDNMRMRPVGWAGAIAGALGTAAAFFLFAPGQQASPILLEADSVEETFALKDGSTVELQPEGQVTLAFTKDARLVTMKQGEAFFVVEKSDRPFRVDVGGLEVLVTGTEFSIEKRHERTEIELIEGSISLMQGDKFLAQLTPGDTAYFLQVSNQLSVVRREAGPLKTRDSGSSTVEGAAQSAFTYHSNTVQKQTAGTLNGPGTIKILLGRYAAMVEDATGQRIRLGSADLASTLISAPTPPMYTTDDLNDIVSRMGLHIRLDNGDIIIERPESAASK